MAWLLAVMCCPSPLCGGLILNAGFETISGWDLSESDPYGYLDGGFTTEWSSEGSQSFRFYRAAGGVSAGDWVEVAQSGVDLTGVTKFVFDCQDTGIDTTPTLYLEFLVDGSQVGTWSNNGWEGGLGSGWGHTAVTTDIEIPLAAPFTGTHELAIRLYQNVSHGPADPKIYRIDNLRAVVPEPSSLTMVLLVLGGAALVRRRRK